MEKKLVIDHLLKNNGFEYNLHKASEEMQELGLVLNQKLLHGCGNVSDQEIIDEIGDVIIRLKILKKMYPKDKIKERVNFKLAKFGEWIETGKYDKI